MKNLKLFYRIAAISFALALAPVIAYRIYEPDLDADEFASLLAVTAFCIGAVNLAIGLVLFIFMIYKEWRNAFLLAGGAVLLCGLISLWIGSML